jgi:hypothetical protein
VDKNGPNGCWVWTAGKNREYGTFNLNGRGKAPVKAHRLSWYIVHGELPDDMHVCHKCDNPSCVNPDHLFLGTTQDNLGDMRNKGRQGHPDNHGERNPASKLTQAQVKEIRQRYGDGTTTSYTLACEFGVSRDAILKLLHNDNWYDPNYTPNPDLFARVHKEARARQCGEQHPLARLTWAEVHAIREMQGEKDSRTVAREFCISITQVNRIWHNRAWKEQVA